MLKILKCLPPLYIGSALGPIGGFSVVTLLPVLARYWSVDFGTASLAICCAMFYLDIQGCFHYISPSIKQCLIALERMPIAASNGVEYLKAI